MKNENCDRVVFFDGVCNFCNYWVNFAIKRDRKKNLHFAPLQGETAKKILANYNISTSSLSSVIFLDNGKIYTQSSAAFRICKHLDNGWKLFYGLMVIPKFIRDAAYNLIAKNRYRWFGKTESCMIPTPDMRERFLD
jgi:predicted DCC family thiol-disulfide oxidoreductase YuxK